MGPRPELSPHTGSGPPPEAANVTRQSASGTDPVPLHPGAVRFYQGG
ncbi:hypothetical protein [Micromonospora sp. KC721]|nr:hypothetical protein [Micromonospora sp. KC721]